MAGPTPVSALIHAATMVTAGVYLMCRLSFLFAFCPVAMLVVACLGAATALFAALIAFAQNDIKKVLAYSTVSQLGFMVLAVGVGAFWAAIFHLVTHAFFKALPLPGLRQRDPRHARRAGHAPHGRPLEKAAPHRRGVRRGHGRHHGCLAALGLLLQGRDPGAGARHRQPRRPLGPLGALPRRQRRGAGHGVLHVAALGAHLHRRPAQRGRRARARVAARR